MPQSRPARPIPAKPSSPAPLEIVDPRWLLKALGFSFAAAFVCGYATLCLLFYQGAWQSVLHPSHTLNPTPDAANLPYSSIHFDSTETGQPRLTGWWIPSGVDSPTANYTILYLHDGSGSLSNTLPALALLHQTGLNIFAIDYRGFGASDASAHPSADRMAEDTSAALDYLTGTRHLAASTIVAFGAGLGASLGANLALVHGELPAVILDNPNPDPAASAVAKHPSDPVPVRVLFGDQFNVARPLATLTTPKLLIAGGPFARDNQPDESRLQALFAHASSPRTTVTLPTANSDRAYLEALSQFLDQYLRTATSPAEAHDRSTP